jgi:hypothetical protein
VSGDGFPRLDRREVLQWMAAAAAQIATLGCATGRDVPELPMRIGTDPDLRNPAVPWPRTLTRRQLETTRALCDLILPADDRSPAASAVGVPDFIDEGISAPYATQQQHREQILAGLAWIDSESQRRFARRFHELEPAGQTAICDDIALVAKAAPERQEAARFFVTLRVLTTGAFYTTREGMRDVGYVGNVPLESFDGPPPALRAHLGLD